MEKKVSKKEDQSSADVNRSHKEEGKASTFVTVPRGLFTELCLKGTDIMSHQHTRMSKCSCIFEHECVEARG